MAKKKKKKKSGKGDGKSSESAGARGGQNPTSRSGQPRRSSGSGKGGATRKPGKDGAANFQVFFLAAALVVGGLLALNLMNSVPDAGTEITNSVAEDVNRKALTEAEARGLAPYFEAAWSGATPDASTMPAKLRRGDAAVYVQPRSAGERAGRSLWRRGKSAEEALKVALRDARSRLKPDELATVDSLEVSLAYNFRSIDVDKDRGKISNVRRGLRGIEFIAKNKVRRYSPTEMIATNRDFKKVIAHFEKQNSLGEGAVKAGRARARIFEADQLVVRLRPNTPPPGTAQPNTAQPNTAQPARTPPGDAGVSAAPAELPAAPATSGVEVVLMYRGNQIIPITDVTRASTQHLADTLSGYLFTNLQPNGRQVYKWWPSRGEETNANNMIRQWMATVAMGRVARKNDEDPLNDDPEQLARVEKNIDYNLAQFYREEPSDKEGEPYGLIEWQGKVKLGAIALTALAIAEHPRRAKWVRHEKGIQRTMDKLWSADGYFKSFYKPTGHRDFHNFYPGEALLYWSTLLEKDGLDTLSADGQTPLIDKFMKSVWYFKEWHLDGTNRNPAFIPWHTQAYYKLWKLTDDKKVLDWTMEMNDWLIDVQQWDERPRFPDTNGRFYDGSRPFGPPHSSSTGVYLEGMIFAWLMAKESGQAEREEKYRKSIMRGLRSCMQLTFFDDVDMFYVKKRDLLRGGVRTTVYNNEVRVDNVQHNLMGHLNILRYMPPGAFHP